MKNETIKKHLSLRITSLIELCDTLKEVALNDVDRALVEAVKVSLENAKGMVG